MSSGGLAPAARREGQDGASGGCVRHLAFGGLTGAVEGPTRPGAVGLLLSSEPRDAVLGGSWFETGRAQCECC